DSARARLDGVAAQIAECRRDFAAQSAQVDSATARHASMKSQLQALQKERAQFHEQQAAARLELAELREQRGALQARRAMLEEFERRQEGLGVGVREILALAKEGAGPPWKNVLGHVVELLEVDLENAALLEVALGSRAQLIVLDDGGPLVDYLGEG